MGADLTIERILDLVRQAVRDAMQPVSDRLEAIDAGLVRVAEAQDRIARHQAADQVRLEEGGKTLSDHAGRLRELERRMACVESSHAASTAGNSVRIGVGTWSLTALGAGLIATLGGLVVKLIAG